MPPSSCARDYATSTSALEALAGDDVARTATSDLSRAGARTADRTFEREDFGALESSLRRIYRRGRKRMRAARAQPTAENLHDCRKRVKDLWHVAQLLHPADPKRMKRLSRRAHELADLLGGHHDLSVLRAYVEVHPRHFEDAPTRDAARSGRSPSQGARSPRAEARPRCLQAAAEALRRRDRAGLAQARAGELSPSLYRLKVIPGR